MAATFSLCGPSGGRYAKEFSDGQTGNRTLKEIKIHSGVFIDSIQVVYSYGGGPPQPNPRRGGTGGKPESLILGDGEYVTEIGGRHGWYVDSLYIKTNKGRAMQCGGKGGNRDFVYHAPPGTRIDGFWGEAAKYLNAIGVIMLTP